MGRKKLSLCFRGKEPKVDVVSKKARSTLSTATGNAFMEALEKHVIELEEYYAFDRADPSDQARVNVAIDIYLSTLGMMWHRCWLKAVKQGDGSLDAYLCMERKKFKALSNVCGYLRANPLRHLRGVCEWLQQYDSLSAKKFPWEKSAETVAKTGGKDNEGYRAGYNKNNGYGKNSGGGNGGYAEGLRGRVKGGAAIRPLAEASNVKVNYTLNNAPKTKDGDKAVKSFAERGGHLTSTWLRILALGETLVPEAIAKIGWYQVYKLEWQVTLEVSIGGKRCRVSGLVFPQDFLEGVPTVLLGWEGHPQDLEAVVSIPQSAFTSGLLGVTVPLILLTGEADRPAISAMALECRPLDGVYAKRRKDCVCLRGHGLTRLSQEKRPISKGPKTRGIIKSNVRDFYRLVLDAARPSNAATSDFTPGSGWVDYTPGVMQALGKIDSSKPKVLYEDGHAYQAFWCMEYATDDDMETQSLFGAVVTGPGGKMRYFLHRKLVMGWKHSSAWWFSGLVNLLETVVPELKDYLVPYVDDILVVASSPEGSVDAFFALVVYALEGAGLELPPSKEIVGASRIHRLPLLGIISRWLEVVGEGVIKYCKTGFSTLKADVSLSALLAPFNDLLASFRPTSVKSTKVSLTPALKRAWSDLFDYCHNRLHAWHGLGEILQEDMVWLLMTDTSPIATSATLWRVPRVQVPRVRELGDEAFQQDDFTGQLWVNFDREMYGVIRGMAIVKDVVMGSYDWSKDDQEDVSRVERVNEDDDISLGGEVRGGLGLAPNEGEYPTSNDPSEMLGDLIKNNEALRSQLIQLYKADAVTEINKVRLCDVHATSLTGGVYSVGEDGLIYKLVCYRGEFRRVIVIPRGTLEESLIYWVDKSYVPSLRRDLVGLVHHVSGHGDVRAALKALRKYVWWPGMSGEVTRVIQACSSCWETKAGADLDTPPNPRAPTVERFDIVHSDFGHPPTGLAQASDPSYVAFLLLVCGGSGYVVSSPVVSEDAGSFVRVLAEKWICYFGVPKTLVSDGGPAYRSRVTEMMASLLGFRCHRVLGYNPQGNGLAERSVGLIKMFMDRLPRALPWDYALTLATYYHNHAVGQGPMPGPAECALGVSRGPLHLFFGGLASSMDGKKVQTSGGSHLVEVRASNEVRGFQEFPTFAPGYEGYLEEGNRVDSAVVIKAPDRGGEVPEAIHKYVHADPDAKTVWVRTHGGVEQRVPYRQLSVRAEEIEFRDQPMHGSPVTLAQLKAGEYAVANVNYGKKAPAFVIVRVEEKFKSDVDVQVYDMEPSTEVFRPLYTDRSHGHFRLQPERGFRLYRVRLPTSCFRSGSFGMTKRMKIPAEVMRRLSEIGVSLAPGGN
ncbi:hypothetical protein FOZ60_000692 [Perkinsus olseni]|uniref:Integrase catalytic domain-containing protein n=1 Tax=Perkinsus olseni TaxID=32597 RepID=A0A7J6P1N4_PEROL|nr:hypothetical protein FOZ60_000692 [Perkinsus olseni]